MSILSELNTLLTPVLPVETGVFSGVPPNEYLVLTPMTDEFVLFGDNKPLIDIPLSMNRHSCLVYKEG